MRKKRKPAHGIQQLYGQETQLIETHGVEHPGPDQGQFPTSSDQPLAGDRAFESVSEEARAVPADRRSATRGNGTHDPRP